MVARPQRPRRRGGVALLVVAALHLVLLSLLSRPSGRLEPRLATPAAVPMRLLAWPERVPERPMPRDAPVTPPTRAPAAIATPRLPSRSTAITADTRPDTPPPEAAPLPQPPASQAPTTLDLTLPRGYGLRPELRQPATDDPRANSVKLTPEQRMARAFDQRVVEERLGDGGLRLRQGADCVIVSPARTSQLFPTDPSAARAPATVGSCP